MPLIRQLWPNAQESCGGEIQTTRLGRKRAWWARGSAIEKFDRDIEPEIEVVLQDVDIQDAEIFFRVYMIGKSEANSRPTIMVCCVDVPIGRRVKESLRDSQILRSNPGFALGSINFPLEQLVPARRLASGMEPESLSEPGSNSAPTVEVFATSQRPTIGRRLLVASPDANDVYRCSTGGIVVSARGRFYQLMADHIIDSQVSTQVSISHMDSDACSFDGQSDGESEDGDSIFERNMRRASMSFCDLSDSGSSDTEIEFGSSSTVNCSSSAGTDYMSASSDATGPPKPTRDGTPESPPAVKVGRVALRSKEGRRPNLDYALVSIKAPKKKDLVNEITLSTGEDSKKLLVYQLADVGREERRVVAVTGSAGVVKGTLMPGTTFLGGAKQRQLQKLYVVQLDGIVAEGDSGAVVVDDTSGDLCGHIVSGCPGTRIAYLVAATETFEDLRARLDGGVSLISHRKAQKPPLQAVSPNLPTNNATKRRTQHARSSDVPHYHANAASTLHSMQTRGGANDDTHHEGEYAASRGSVHPYLRSAAKAWDPVFSIRRSLSYSSENRPFIQTLRELDPEKDCISLFMRGAQASELCSFEVEEMEAFFTKGSLKTLQFQENQYRQPPVALIDDTCGDGKTRHNSGPLTAHELYRALSKPRFRTTPAEKSGLCDERDAERRLIYITDLDRLAATALVATASNFEARSLASAIRMHLMWRSSLQISVFPGGTSSFELEFHIPYFAWRTGMVHFQDARQRAGGTPLRKSVDLSFLRPECDNAVSGRGTDCLYEAQVSCVVTGHDDWRWTAYFFIDTYLFGPAGSDTALPYDKGFDATIGTHPITGTASDANTPIRNARLYFLRALENRSLHVEQEGRNVVDRLQRMIHTYTSDHPFSFHRDAAADVGVESARRAHERIIRTLRLIKQIQQALSDSVFHYQKFMESDAGYFTDKHCLEQLDKSAMSSLLSVERSSNGLGALERRLHYLIEHCEDYLKALELHLSLEGNELAGLQRKRGEEIRFLALVAILFWPISVGSIFSMQPSAIPVAIIILLLISVLFVAVSLPKEWRQRILDALLPSARGRELLHEKMQRPLNRLLGRRAKKHMHEEKIDSVRFPEPTFARVGRGASGPC